MAPQAPALSYSVRVPPADPGAVDVEVAAHGFFPQAWHPEREAARRFASAFSTTGPEVRYRINVASMAQEEQDPDIAAALADGWLLSDAALLWRPENVPAGVRVDIFLPPDWAAPWVPVPLTPGAYTLTGEQLQGGAYLFAGPNRALPLAPSLMVSARLLGESRADPEKLTGWLEDSVRMVADFYGGRLPLAPVQVLLAPVPDSTRGARFGTTMRWGLGSILLYVGENSDAASLKGDWVAPHELLHLGNPHVQGRIPWFIEGFTTYLTNVVRARSGARTEEAMWEDLLTGFDHACTQPQTDTLMTASAAMRRTHRYLRVYWGGACAAFWVDVALRRATGGKRSLEALLGDLRTRSLRQPLTEAQIRQSLFSALDARAHDRSTLRRILDGKKHVSLQEVMKNLGVVGDGRKVKLEQNAPWANIRRAIMAR